MVKKLSELMGKKVAILLTGGAKGIIKIKGKVTDTNEEEGMITITIEGGMMGGKKREMMFNIYSILGVEIEQ